MKFEFYNLVWFWNNHSDYTKTILGRWLGVSHRVGIALCYWILSDKGNFYHAPPFRILIITNQGILTFINGSLINMAHWKPHLEVKTLEIVCMDMNPSLMMVKRVLQSGNLMRRNKK